MAYSVPFPVALGDAYSGISDLVAALLDASLNPTGSPQGFTEIDGGFYALMLAVSDDDFKGYVRVYSAAVPGETLALAGVDPTLKGIETTVNGISGGAGMYTVTLQFFQTGTAIPLPDVEFTVSIAGAVITFGQADVTGVKTVYLDAATYTLELKLTGVSFDVESFTVTADGTFVFYGTPATTDPPIAADECHVYADIRGQSSGVIPASVTAKAKILELPHESGDQYFSGEDYNAEYNATIGRLSWRIVRGARVEFRLPPWYNLSGEATIPDQSDINLKDLLSS